MAERKPVEIDKASAVALTKWRIQQVIEHENPGIFRKMALKAAIAPGGAVDEIASMLYDDMDVRLSLDKNNALHAGWLWI